MTLVLTTPDEMERLEELNRRYANCQTWLWMHDFESGTRSYARVESELAGIGAEIARLTGTTGPMIDTAL